MRSSVILFFALAIGLSSIVLPGRGQVLSSVKKTDQNVTPVSGTNSADQVYRNLLAEQALIGEQISALSLSLHTASASKAKKINKELAILTDQLVVVERKLAAFPVSVANPSVSTTSSDVDQAFINTMDSVAAVRISQSNPFQGRLSSDPNLERMYRAYISENGENMPSVAMVDGLSITTTTKTDYATTGDKVYRVMIAIGKSQLPMSSFNSLGDVIEQRVANGYAYYQGAYSSLNEAQTACNRILAAGQFRDAFVVAMVGNRRVPLTR